VEIAVSANASIKAALRHRVAGSIATLKRIAKAISLALLSGVSWMFAASRNRGAVRVMFRSRTKGRRFLCRLNRQSPRRDY
jgi:hypothetical protein